MIARALATAILLLLAVIVWQRGTVAKHESVATAATSRAEAAESREAAALAEREVLAAALAAERARAQRMAAVAGQYEEEKRNAEERAEKLAAAVRAGAVRLRQRWQVQSCPAAGVPATAASTGEPDAGTTDRAESAARIVRAAAECDAQVRGLQAVIQADRGVQP